jgi:hypothetical protein
MNGPSWKKRAGNALLGYAGASLLGAPGGLRAASALGMGLWAPVGGSRRSKRSKRRSKRRSKPLRGGVTHHAGSLRSAVYNTLEQRARTTKRFDLGQIDEAQYQRLMQPFYDEKKRQRLELREHGIDEEEIERRESEYEDEWFANQIQGGSNILRGGAAQHANSLRSAVHNELWTLKKLNQLRNSGQIDDFEFDRRLDNVGSEVVRWADYLHNDMGISGEKIAELLKKYEKEWRSNNNEGPNMYY